MSVSVTANKLSIVHKGSNGISSAFPDVCKTPAPPAPPIPIPYPNIAKSSDLSGGSKKVKADGQSIALKDANFMMSTGDEAGSLMGVASNKIKGKAEFVNASFDVKIEGKGVCRQFELMLHNDKNTPPFPVLQGPAVAVGMEERPKCLLCEKEL
ncbi:MAG TPA: DUF4150 domain-containing protein [Fibrobacteria bacterium]|nr:DUF4150 domain-containing protein [Fibrobacteria bacterium]